jgi:hypothetical protein
MTARAARQMFAVKVAAHRAGRWQLPERAVTIPAANRAHARVIAVREAHAAAMPCWRLLVRKSLQHTTAEPVEGGQLALRGGA